MPENRRLETEKNLAEQAFKDAKSGSEAPFSADYKSLVKKTPARIKTNGLTATVAFLFSKRHSNSGVAHKFLYEQLSGWLSTNKIVDLGREQTKELAQVLAEMSYAEIRNATNESLAYLTWLKRFTEGLIKKDGEN